MKANSDSINNKCKADNKTLKSWRITTCPAQRKNAKEFIKYFNLNFFILSSILCQFFTCFSFSVLYYFWMYIINFYFFPLFNIFTPSCFMFSLFFLLLFYCNNNDHLIYVNYYRAVTQTRGQWLGIALLWGKSHFLSYLKESKNLEIT